MIRRVDKQNFRFEHPDQRQAAHLDQGGRCSTLPSNYSRQPPTIAFPAAKTDCARRAAPRLHGERRITGESAKVVIRRQAAIQ